MVTNRITSEILRIFRQSARRLFCIASALLLAAFAAVAANSQDSKTLLVINSYNESSPWSRAVTMPINNYVKQHEGVKVEMVYINNNAISDSAAYYLRTDAIFKKYESKAPDYVVMLGNMAFNMRERIKQEWKDVPVLLVARQMDYGPLDYYFSGYETRVTEGEMMPLSTLRADYNFTVVLMPDLYKPTIDMMVSLIPNMDRFVFISDGIYLNRVLASEIDEYIQEEYPTIVFEWLHASNETASELHRYLAERQPHTGLLMSTWFYEVTDASNRSLLVAGDLNLISSSVNPIFSLRQSYLSLGTVGGVYPDYEQIKCDIITVVDKMFAGEDLRKVPFYDHERECPIVNYPLLTGYGLNPKDCPADTEFYAKPLSWWQLHRMGLLLVLIVVIIAAFVIWRKTELQRRSESYSKRVDKFIANMPVPFSMATVFFDKKGNVLRADYTLKNDAFKRILQDNTNGGQVDRLFNREFITEKVNTLIATHRPISFIHHFDKTDTYYDFLVCMVDRGDYKESDELEVDIFATDITESYKLSSRLESATNKLSLVLNAASLVPWQWEVKSDKLCYNTTSLFKRKLEQTGQISIDDEVESSMREYEESVHPDDLDMVRTLNQNIKDGKVDDFSMQFRRMRTEDPSGPVDWVEISGMVTKRDEEGKAVIVTGSMQMVTERKQQEEEMKRAMERANESDYMKSAFLANMSHEIRTPLNAIVGFSSLVAKTESPQKREEFAQLIEKNNELLLAIVNDVLDLAKIESNTIDISYGPCDVNQVIEKMAETIDVRVPKGVVLNLAPGAQVCVVNTDENRLSQVLVNLLTNACKFTTKGSITLGYDIQDGDELYFYIKDTGIGIAPEDQDRVFERFVKVNNFAQGTGLGLAICKSIIEKMGGTMGVRSGGKNAGSTFWFTLPYIPAEILESSDIDKIAEAAENDGKLQPKHMGLPQSQSLGTMLVAEDNHSNFRLIEHFLGSSYKIIRAENGEEAVELYKEHRPDVVLMDISMPVMDGYQATAEIRKVSPTVPIIAVTAYALNSDRERIMRSGFTAYVSKPIIQKELIQAVMSSTQGGGAVKIC